MINSIQQQQQKDHSWNSVDCSMTCDGSEMCSDRNRTDDASKHAMPMEDCAPLEAATIFDLTQRYSA